MEVPSTEQPMQEDMAWRVEVVSDMCTPGDASCREQELTCSIMTRTLGDHWTETKRYKLSWKGSGIWVCRRA